MMISKPSVIKSEKFTFKVNLSQFHAIGFALLSGLLIVALLRLPWGGWVIPLVLAWGYLHYQHHFGRHRIKEIAQGKAGEWLFDGMPYRILPSSSIRRFWVVLYLSPRSAKICLIPRVLAIFPDSMDVEGFRQLRKQFLVTKAVDF